MQECYPQADWPPQPLTCFTVCHRCFWGLELAFQRVPGVVKTSVGYTGGQMEYPSYEEVCMGVTGHAEVVQVTYDPDQVRSSSPPPPPNLSSLHLHRPLSPPSKRHLTPPGLPPLTPSPPPPQECKLCVCVWWWWGGAAPAMRNCAWVSLDMPRLCKLRMIQIRWVELAGW
jgi:hypothetical protein